MATRQPSGSSLPRRRGPRYRVSGESPQKGSESYRFFREVTDGLSNRIPLPSLEGMRAGTVNNPVSLMRRFFVAMRSAGLPKEPAQRVLVWLTHTVDGLWPLEATPLPELERRAMVQECADDQAELAYHNQRCRETLEARRDALLKEIAADQMLLARMNRELEAL